MRTWWSFAIGVLVGGAAVGCSEQRGGLTPADVTTVDRGMDAPTPKEVLRRLRSATRETPIERDSIQIWFDGGVDDASHRQASVDAASLWLGAIERELRQRGLPTELVATGVVRTPRAVILTASQTWQGVPVLNRGVVVQVSARKALVSGRILVEAAQVGAQPPATSEAEAMAAAEAIVESQLRARVLAMTASRVVLPADIAGGADARSAWAVTVSPEARANVMVFVDATTGRVFRVDDTTRQHVEHSP